ncbi:hypothetical protein [uncultured Campylobacter sp.]|uniref:hypothetical protein n=1 Tax=uncultured Campylobacter sp. TaxID=218934 RepID=UPI0026317824|nr:hypothetical protein [uncultured Campylobacter sp.]
MLTLSMMVYNETGINLKEYCKQRGLPQISNGSYVSRRAARVLDADGIPWRESSNAQISGGSNGAVFYISEGVVKAPDGSSREMDKKEAEELFRAYD